MRPRTEIPGPDWLGAYLDEVLDSGPGTVGGGRLDAIHLDEDDKPVKTLSASYAGLVVSYLSSPMETRFIRWSAIEQVTVSGTSVVVGTISMRFREATPEESEAAARRFAADIIRLMRGSR